MNEYIDLYLEIDCSWNLFVVLTVGETHSPLDLLGSSLVDLVPSLDYLVFTPETTDILDELSLQVRIPEMIFFVADQRVLTIHIINFI